jgi:two-component system, NtrC family, sensor histidine kinase HydH
MANIESYKNQETTLILMNFAVLAGLLFIHVCFITTLGPPRMALLLTLFARSVLLVFELLWVQRSSADISETAVNTHIWFSIVVNIAVAFFASVFSGEANSHYSVLMIIPIISAAYRFKLPATIFVTAVAIALSFLQIFLHYRAFPPADITEYFEAATVSLLFLVVAVVVKLLVNDLHRVQDKLVAEEKLAVIGELSSAIAHEIRNPVTMIASSLKMAEAQPENSAIRQEMFQIASQEAKRLENMTTDFLAFARVRKPALSSASVSECLNYIVGLTKAHFTEKELELELICDESLTFEMDSSQMQQALLNLLMNAIKATPRNGKIELGAKKVGDRSVLYVNNEGEQIADDIAPRIFEPFFTSGNGGTGLGLAIVRNIARAHGGDIYLVENRKGSVQFEMIF